MNKNITCSACGRKTNNLHLVTIPYDEQSLGGRVLIYCYDCRQSKQHIVDLCIPLQMVTSSFLIKLYSLGRTNSDVNAVLSKLKIDDKTLLQKLEKINSENSKNGIFRSTD